MYAYLSLPRSVQMDGFTVIWSAFFRHGAHHHTTNHTNKHSRATIRDTHSTTGTTAGRVVVVVVIVVVARLAGTENARKSDGAHAEGEGRTTRSKDGTAAPRNFAGTSRRSSPSVAASRTSASCAHERALATSHRTR